MTPRKNARSGHEASAACAQYPDLVHTADPAAPLQMRRAEKDVYYNEFAKFPIAWLTELAAVGAIPSGRIDGRPIQEVQASDLAGYDACHFFAGIGVWSYVLKNVGWPPGLRTWTGSPPCQPWSQAGKKGGVDDDRHLWPVFHRLIGECQPQVVLGEQVSGPNGRTWLDIVFDDLENLGYACGALDIPAASVGSPQIRQRQYWLAARLADASDIQCQLQSRRRKPPVGRQEPVGDGGPLASAGSPAGYWSDAVFHDCADGFARPVGAGIGPVVDRSPASLESIRGYGNACNAQLAIAFADAALEALRGFDP